MVSITGGWIKRRMMLGNTSKQKNMVLEDQISLQDRRGTEASMSCEYECALIKVSEPQEV